MKKNHKTFVISGVSMKEGGINSVLKSVISAAERILGSEWRIVALVHRVDGIKFNRAELFEFPMIKRAWARRIWFEWVTSKKISKDIDADVWLSLHDVTSIVNSHHQFVYCHNPSFADKIKLRNLIYDRTYFIFTIFYSALYRLNIKNNTNVFVQQKWMADAFRLKYGINNVVVARPGEDRKSSSVQVQKIPIDGCYRRWIYPAYPRTFKNVEIIGEAVKILELSSDWNGVIFITMDGSENKYSNWLLKKYGNLRTLKFIGLQNRMEIENYYQTCDGLIFPSTVETWGLPITEAQHHGLPILTVDMPYAHETVGNYHSAMFFDPNDHAQLADIFNKLWKGSIEFKEASYEVGEGDNFIVGWDGLIEYIMDRADH